MTRSDGPWALVWMAFVAAAMLVLGAVVFSAVRHGMQGQPLPSASPSLSAPQPASPDAAPPRPGPRPTASLYPMEA
jgi:hypothetical protein